jgi:hypothetical protein
MLAREPYILNNPLTIFTFGRSARAVSATPYPVPRTRYPVPGTVSSLDRPCPPA